jgi:16S rRNA (guanine(527)-N(7))-methyltransferase RsmG
MHPARIAELLEPFLGPRDQRPKTQDLIPSISTYIDILLHWNARINLTAIRDPEDIVTRHFGESLFAARQLFPMCALGGTAAPGCPAERSTAAHDAAEDVGGRAALGGRAVLQGRVSEAKEFGALAPEVVANDQGQTTNDRVADLGSGAGFPGLPIKLWAPHLSLTLIESNHKKTAFLREVTRALTLTNVNIQNTRAETLSTTFNVVILRAVERFDAILPTAAALVAQTGRLALLISAAQQSQARSTLPHLVWSDPVPIPQSRSRILLIAHRVNWQPAAEPSM